MSDERARARAAARRAKREATQAERKKPTKAVVTGRPRIAEKKRGEQVVLPADVARRNVKRGFIRLIDELEDTQPLPVIHLGDEDPAEETADHGPSVPNSQEG